MSIQSIRGMRDLLPKDVARWHYIENILIETTQSYGFRELRPPLLELTALFSRSVGESTDIVEKEMYTLADRDGESISLRPEGTASCVRAALQQGLLYNQVQQFWYRGPMFRYERPQRGRYRQFEQFGVETFGVGDFTADAEVIQLSAAVFDALNLRGALTLELNSLGTQSNRQAFTKSLVQYLTPIKAELDEDSQRRLASNPLRILDSKVKQTQAMLDQGPRLENFIDEESGQHFEQLKQLLQSLGIAYQINPGLVRGLDYYTHTVFEWTTDALGAQGTVCAGGRYDGLVEQLGGRATPGVGYAMGVDRLVLLHEALEAEFTGEDVDVYCTVLEEAQFPFAFDWCARLRKQLPGLSVCLHKSTGKLQKQMKRADKSGARVALLIGEEEILQNKVTIKWLREERAQQTLDFTELCACLEN